MRLFPILIIIALIWACTPSRFVDRGALSEQSQSESYSQDTLESQVFLEEGEAYIHRISDSLIQKILERQKQRLKEELKAFSIEVPLNEEAVARWVEFYSGVGLPTLIRFYRRGTKYIPRIKEILESAGLPKDLAYLPIVESGYNPYARSRAGAVGIWQFMRGTARKYGLRVDWWVDDRRDPIKSTWAAVEYLKDLYSYFGRWDLVLAAYNTGEGKVSRTIRRLNSTDYWELRSRLPRETRNYVPAFFAVLMIVKHGDLYGLKLDTIDADVWEYDSVFVPRQIELNLVAKWAKTSVREIQRLNPRYRRWATPPDEKGFYLRVPVGTRDLVIAGMKATPEKLWVTKLIHRVRRGESLWVISRRYGVSISAIARANGIHNPRHIRPGQLLWIPVPGKNRTSYSSRRAHRPSTTAVADNTAVSYRVRKGDTLWEIARKFGIKVRDLKRWNNLHTSLLHPGQRLIIYPRGKGFITYEVQKGDTLTRIARMYDVSVSELMRINGIRNPRRLRPGQRLRIPSGG